MLLQRAHLSSISQALGDNPELLGSLAGAAFEGLIGGNVGIGAQQGLMGAQNIIQKQQQQAQNLEKARSNQREDQRRDFELLLKKEGLDIKKSAALSKLNKGTLKPEQYKQAVFARRMEQSEGVLDALDSEGYDPTTSLSTIAGFLPAKAQTESRKRYDQAKSNFILANLRDESRAKTSKSITYYSGFKKLFWRSV